MSAEEYNSYGEFVEDSNDPGSDDNHPLNFTLGQIQQLLNEGKLKIPTMLSKRQPKQVRNGEPKHFSKRRKVVNLVDGPYNMLTSVFQD